MNIADIYHLFKNSKGICTDTRKIEKDTLFFALKGEKFNANEYAAAALAEGAAYAIIDEEKYILGDRTVLVKDVLSTLQQLAHYHRKQLDIPIIALTGSNGKTTNKELLHAVLSTQYKTHATQGNLNNHIGVPLTLLAMPTDTEMAIIEMGANHQKEIEMLCRIAEPNFGFITNIGKAHLEGFGGTEGIKKGKGEMYDWLKASQGVVFVNQNDETLINMVKEKGLLLTVYYGADERALELVSFNPVIEFKIDPQAELYKTQMGGTYNFENMQTAYAIGRYFNIPAEKAAKALAEYSPENNRSQVVHRGSNDLLMDAYNANPSSMEAAIRNFALLKTEKAKVVILGDMFELGEESIAEHQKLGALVAESNFEMVVLYGQNMQHALAHLPNAYYFTDKFSLHNWVADKAFQDKYIMIKGSRGVALETIVPFIN